VWDVAKKGNFRWFRRENFVYVQWHDCKVETFMSPLHQGIGICCFFIENAIIKSRKSSKKKLVQPSVAIQNNELNSV
jgi:hypothetical protein